jgi:hypothetical protein
MVLSCDNFLYGFKGARSAPSVWLREGSHERSQTPVSCVNRGAGLDERARCTRQDLTVTGPAAPR